MFGIESSILQELQTVEELLNVNERRVNPLQETIENGAGAHAISWSCETDQTVDSYMHFSLLRKDEILERMIWMFEELRFVKFEVFNLMCAEYR